MTLEGDVKLVVGYVCCHFY